MNETRVGGEWGGVYPAYGLRGCGFEHRLARCLLPPRKLPVPCTNAIPSDDLIDDLATGDTSPRTTILRPAVARPNGKVHGGHESMATGTSHPGSTIITRVLSPLLTARRRRISSHSWVSDMSAVVMAQECSVHGSRNFFWGGPPNRPTAGTSIS